MLAQIDAACATAGTWPDAILSGHSHNYQRYLRKCRTTKGKAFSISYLVAGTGGIQVQPAPSNIGHAMTEKAPSGLAASSVGYQNGLESHGYMRVTASATTLALTFVPTQDNQPDQFETVEIDLASHDLRFS
jgi:hypothetical protein